MKGFDRLSKNIIFGKKIQTGKSNINQPSLKKMEIIESKCKIVLMQNNEKRATNTRINV